MLGVARGALLLDDASQDLLLAELKKQLAAAVQTLPEENPSQVGHAFRSMLEREFHNNDIPVQSGAAWAQSAVTDAGLSPWDPTLGAKLWEAYRKAFDLAVKATVRPRSVLDDLSDGEWTKLMTATLAWEDHDFTRDINAVVETFPRSMHDTLTRALSEIHTFDAFSSGLAVATGTPNHYLSRSTSAGLLITDADSRNANIWKAYNLAMRRAMEDYLRSKAGDDFFAARANLVDTPGLAPNLDEVRDARVPDANLTERQAAAGNEVAGEPEADAP
jgi:hypothetical protein